MELIDKNDPTGPDNRLVWSPQVREMLGQTDASDVSNSLADWSVRLHPDDKDAAQRAFAAHIMDYSGQTPFKKEYRLMTEQGAYRYFRALGNTLRDVDGTPLRVAGTLEDITEQVRTQEALERRGKRLVTLNKAATVLLSQNGENYEDTLTEGSQIIADIADIDRISLYRNSKEPEGLCGTQVYLWRKDVGSKFIPRSELNKKPLEPV
jgi:PAS domain S-box-containing protein